MNNYDEAVKILNTDPLPDDAEERFNDLILKSQGLERQMIEKLSESLFEQRNQ